MPDTKLHSPSFWDVMVLLRSPGAFVVLCSLVIALAAGPAHAEDLIGNDEQVARLDVCYDFGCASTKRVYVFETEWRPVARSLMGSRSAQEERHRIARAVAAMERLVGEVTPTGADRAGNDYEGDDPSGQMDCIDESTNTTTYLKLFEAQGLIVFHRVAEPVYRAPVLLDQHWAARIEEKATGRQFAVDSWPRDNGELPMVQDVEQWRRDVAPRSLAAVIVHGPVGSD